MAFRDWLPTPVRHLAARALDNLIGDDPAPIIRTGDYNRPVPYSEAASDIAKPDTSQYGATGTPIISGFVTELEEYNAELRGRNALRIYEQMRRSDADVAAVLSACKLPIRSAEFQMVPGIKANEPDYGRAKEVAEFVQECLFDDLEYENALGVKFSQRFESVIENALLCLDFGCAGYEDLWTIDQDRIRLRRLAPRLPSTFYRFHVDKDGETLRAIEQWGYRGDTWVTALVPANKFALFSLRQEGANFYGRSILREAYQHWFVKNALYRIDAIACERNGAGVPTIIMGANPSVEDKDAAKAWTESLATHESTSLVLPNGWDFKLHGVQGQEHNLLPSIQHHSEMICRSALAMFMALGTTQSGSRALGNTMVDFFQLSDETIARFVCDTIRETTIRRLTDFNFSYNSQKNGFNRNGKRLAYPRLIFPNIAVLNPLDIMAALKDIGSSTVDMLQPDDETENWLRKKIGMPLKTKTRPRYAPVVERIQEESTQTPEEIQEGKPTNGAAPKVKPNGQQAPNLPGKKKLMETALLRRALEDRLQWHGLNVSIEHAAGSTRSGKGPQGDWSVTMQYPYGYIRRTEGADGDHVDCYVGPDETAEFVYIVHQNHPETGVYDEDKCMLNFPSAEAAKDAYLAHHSEGTRAFGSMDTLPVEEFIEKVQETFDQPGMITAAELSREIKPHEKKHDFAGHARRQDATQAAIRRILGGAKPALFREAARRAAGLEPSHLGTLSLPFDRGLAQRVAQAVTRAHQYGYDQVYAERYRGTKRAKSQKPQRTLSESAKQDKPGAIAEAAIGDLNNWVTGRAKGAHIDNYKQGLRDMDLEEGILEDLLDGSDGQLDRIALEAGRSGVAGGRWAAFEELGDEIASYVRSEAMDKNTCESCAAGDGTEWDTLDEVDWSPGDDCDGDDACRGQIMPVFADENTVELE